MDSGELFIPTPKKKSPKAVYGIMGKAGAGKDTSVHRLLEIIWGPMKHTSIASLIH